MRSGGYVIGWVLESAGTSLLIRKRNEEVIMMVSYAAFVAQ